MIGSNTVRYVISGFYHGVNEVLALLGLYSALIGSSYRRFGNVWPQNVGNYQ
jgi:hypothetical protein